MEVDGDEVSIVVPECSRGLTNASVAFMFAASDRNWNRAKDLYLKIKNWE